MQANLEIEIPEDFITAGKELALSDARIQEIFEGWLHLIIYERIIPDYLEDMIQDLPEEVKE
jgi:hypothetical protein